MVLICMWTTPLGDSLKRSPYGTPMPERASSTPSSADRRDRATVRSESASSTAKMAATRTKTTIAMVSTENCQHATRADYSAPQNHPSIHDFRSRARSAIWIPWRNRQGRNILRVAARSFRRVRCQHCREQMRDARRGDGLIGTPLPSPRPSAIRGGNDDWSLPTGAPT